MTFLTADLRHSTALWEHDKELRVSDDFISFELLSFLNKTCVYVFPLYFSAPAS